MPNQFPAYAAAPRASSSDTITAATSSALTGLCPRIRCALTGIAFSAMQAGNVVIPGSKNPEHIKANFELFDFELTADEMAQIAAMNQNKRYYTSTPELLKKYAEMVPPVDEQK